MKPLLFAFLTGVALSSPLAAKTVTIGPGERPAKLRLPDSYRTTGRYPLIVSLHGVGGSALVNELFFGFGPSQKRYDFLLIEAEGTVRPSDGKRFWNAFPACCDKDNLGIDDAGYLRGLIEEAKARFQVDPAEVYVYGHSNGGFMAHRLACENDGLIKGIVSVAGSISPDPALCPTRSPISVLQIHGTGDATVYYDPSGKDKDYRAAPDTVRFWAEHNGCRNSVSRPKSLNLKLVKWEINADEDLNPQLSGKFSDFVSIGFKPETDAMEYTDCEAGVQVGLWTIPEAGHGPIFAGTDVVGKALRFLRGQKP